MGHGKLKKFAENETFRCLLQPDASAVLAKEPGAIDRFDKRLLWNFLVSNKCYRRAFFLENGVRFPATGFSEEGAFFMDAVYAGGTIVSAWDSVVWYRRHTDAEGLSVSQTANVKNLESLFGSMTHILEAAKKAKGTDDLTDDYLQEVLYKHAHILLSQFYRALWQMDDAAQALCVSQLQSLFDRLTESGRAVRFLFLDIDDMKGINDRHGHDGGDAAIRAARRGSAVIEERDMHTAFVAAVAGEDRKAAAARDELNVIALHEAGHAVASRLLLPGHRIERVSILPASNGAAGYNLTIPAERALPDLNGLAAQVQVLLAGRAAEQLLSSETNLTAGASGDLTQATELASAMVLDLGFVGSPAVSLRTLSRCTGSGAQDAAALVKRLLDDCYQAVRALLEEHADLLAALAERLLEAESLTGREVEAFFKQTGV